MNKFRMRPLCPENPEARKWMDEAADRIAELEAREPLCRCADEVRCDYLKRIAELEAKLDRVRGLPEKWRNEYAEWDNDCADELQCALGDEE